MVHEFTDALIDDMGKRGFPVRQGSRCCAPKIPAETGKQYTYADDRYLPRPNPAAPYVIAVVKGIAEPVCRSDDECVRRGPPGYSPTYRLDPA